MKDESVAKDTMDIEETGSIPIFFGPLTLTSGSFAAR